MAPQTATREEWIAARKALLDDEKELTRRSDALAARRRELPRVAVDTEYVFQTNDGPKTLEELFDGRSQLIVYHFMLGPNTPGGREGCTYATDGFQGSALHLAHHDVTFLMVSRASLDDGVVYHSYSAFDRGTDVLNP